MAAFLSQPPVVVGPPVECPGCDSLIASGLLLCCATCWRSLPPPLAHALGIERRGWAPWAELPSAPDALRILASRKAGMFGGRRS